MAGTGKPLVKPAVKVAAVMALMKAARTRGSEGSTTQQLKTAGPTLSAVQTGPPQVLLHSFGVYTAVSNSPMLFVNACLLKSTSTTTQFEDL